MPRLPKRLHPLPPIRRDYEGSRLDPAPVLEGGPSGPIPLPGARSGGALNTRTVQQVCQDARQAAGLGKHVTVHTLRHYAESLIMPSRRRWLPNYGGFGGLEVALLGIIRGPQGTRVVYPAP